MMRELAQNQAPSHPVLRGQGWWRRPGRFLCPPVATPAVLTSISADGHRLVGSGAAPILITGATGTLGRAFARICDKRNLSYRLLGRQELDIADPAAVERALLHYQPWAVVNASGYVRVDQAESDIARCFRDNAEGPTVLAAACARHGVHLSTFSSDLVFDGNQQQPYVESDAVAPLNVYGQSKVAAERAVLEHHPAALVVRSSAFFGPWDRFNFLTQALATLDSGAPFGAAADMTVSPTYVPDLVHACLDLIIDRECGLWHLTNGHPLTWLELAEQTALQAGVDTSRLHAQLCSDCNYAAARPLYSALDTGRAIMLPTLDSAIGRFIEQRRQGAEHHTARSAKTRQV
jgi:dTDP-4-dehydrorhamnose reductase